MSAVINGREIEFWPSTNYCRFCMSHHRLSEFCNEDGRTETRLILSLSDVTEETP